ncbi:PK4 / Protein kinase [Leishmania donovani]|uniref:Protein kinase domain family protein n=1 Tax=Leishmania donovani TaxID=5661 RepID=A0A504Y3E2_LEIDO|nr:Protein kinase domain family protein [Leishmania donovani]CAJ1988671.1 PK4 / Protein kinase [Leishmania donovani]VDZ44551.1 protein_kinase_putative/GeneDB:LmjF.21.1650 [Leishmania donovani]
MPTSSGVDQAKLREVIRVLKSVGHVGMAESLEVEWGMRPNTASHAKNAKKGRKSQPHKSRESSKARGNSFPSLSSIAVAPSPLQVTSQRRFVVTCIGDEEDLWSPDEDPADAKCCIAPLFDYGAGLLRDHYVEYAAHPVSLVSVHPYEKQQPPSNLPWRHFELKVFYEAGKTGSEEKKEFELVKGYLIGGRYRVDAPIDAATFSRTVRCYDEQTGQPVCLKIIRNSKTFLDQGLDELRALTCVNDAGDADACCVVRLLDYFYFREHLVLVTELLFDNLYEYARKLDIVERCAYFTLARLQRIVRQVLTALKLIHSVNLIHCDIKPENIAFKSVADCDVKVLDLGSSCYMTDTLSSYVQSRSYRAPEVILGCKYGPAVDIWSLGATAAELATGTVLFNVESVPTMLASIASVCGPIPAEMLQEGRNTSLYVTKHGAFYDYEDEQLVFHFPSEPPDAAVLFGFDDHDYVGFVRLCLTLDAALRPSAAQLLDHPFLTKTYTD